MRIEDCPPSYGFLPPPQFDTVARRFASFVFHILLFGHLNMRIFSVLAVTLAVAAPFSAAPARDEAVAEALAAEHRSPNFLARDQHRHPQEVLEFLGLTPAMTVVEIAPGGGYWTEILGPYLHQEGTYYTAIAPRAASARSAGGRQLAEEARRQRPSTAR